MVKSSKLFLDDEVTQRADIWGFGSTIGYNVTPHYRVLGSLHVVENFKKLIVENRGYILLIINPPICKTGSPSCGDLDICYFSSW